MTFMKGTATYIWHKILTKTGSLSMTMIVIMMMGIMIRIEMLGMMIVLTYLKKMTFQSREEKASQGKIVAKVIVLIKYVRDVSKIGFVNKTLIQQ